MADCRHLPEALLALTGTFEELYSLAMFAIWTFFLLTGVALIRLRIKEPALLRPTMLGDIRGLPWSLLVRLSP